MSFYEPKDLCIGTLYKLTEIVEGIKVSAGDHFLVSMDMSSKMMYPVLGFSKINHNKGSKAAEVFLIEAHAQFGSPTWRRAFRRDNYWEVYWPAGGRTWNHSRVVVEKAD